MTTRRISIVRAAGCVVWRYGSSEPEVLVVHRPRWDDISFPKGKLERGESTAACAVREVEEETTLRVRLGVRLRDDHYVQSNGQPKAVSYWSAQPPRLADISRHESTAEIDEVRWLSISKARRQLSYPRDIDLLDEFLASPFDASVLLILRHAEARKRRTWRGDDLERPLTAAGRVAAARLAPVLDAYGITRVITSDALRCVDTVMPFVDRCDVKLKMVHGLSEQGVTKKSVAAIAATALESDKRMLICTHRPVLPRLFAALGIGDVTLDTAQMLVVHRAGGKIAAIEKPE